MKRKKIENTKNNRKNNLKDKILFFLYPFRDSIGITVGATPFRIGEIYTVIYSIFCSFSGKTYRNFKIDKRIRNIFLLLLLNLFLTCSVSCAYFNSIDTDFCQKYLIRNGITIFLFLCIYHVYIAYNERLVINGMKWNIILQILAAILFFALYKRIFMNQLTSIWDIQTASYGTIDIPRYPGTCSESGYLGPLLAMPLYYFLSKFKENKIWLIVCLILLIVSVSTSNFFIIFLTFMFYAYERNRGTFFKMLVSMLAVLVLFVIIIQFLPHNSFAYTVINSNFNKFIAYISLGKYGKLDWSASDRVEHLSSAINMFLRGNFFEVLLGHGTGAYSFYAMHNTHLSVQNVEEAYNLYLSTLTDRGIIGFIIFIAIFYNVYKVKTNNPISNAIWFGIVIQLIHYMIVGNMWLYYVWQEALFLIGYEINLNHKNNC